MTRPQIRTLLIAIGTAFLPFVAWLTLEAVTLANATWGDHITESFRAFAYDNPGLMALFLLAYYVPQAFVWGHILWGGRPQRPPRKWRASDAWTCSYCGAHENAGTRCRSCGAPNRKES